MTSRARGWLMGALASCLAAVPTTSSAEETRTVALDVPGFLPAVLVIPPGTSSRPLVVAAHGAGGAPEWDCEYWARLTAGRAFVLCLRGTAMGSGRFYYKNHHALDAELAAALAASHQSYPRISSNSGIYAGFSQGASMGALMIPKYAAQLPYVVLIEGFEQWNNALGRSFMARGGKSALLVCGSRECASKAEPSARALERAGVRARYDHAPGAGHSPAGPVEALVVRDFPWLVGGDAAWAN